MESLGLGCLGLGILRGSGVSDRSGQASLSQSQLQAAPLVSCLTSPSEEGGGSLASAAAHLLCCLLCLLGSHRSLERRHLRIRPKPFQRGPAVPPAALQPATRRQEAGTGPCHARNEERQQLPVPL